MKLSKILILSLLSLLFLQCGNSKKPFQFVVKTNKADNKFHLGEKLSVKIETEDKRPISKVVYEFQDASETVSGEKSFEFSLDKALLGKYPMNVKVYFEGGEVEKIAAITILNNKAPKVYSYKIIKKYPHNTKHYTQGLEFKDNYLYESTGHYGESKLLKKDLVTGETLKEHDLKDDYFGEGITIVHNKIHQLTWKKNIGFTYDLETFKQEGSFAYNESKQGWGICFDGNNTIYKSDGTTKIWKLNAKTLEEKGSIQVTTNKSIKSRFNELEWVNGKIYANTWQKDGIAIINPENGAIEAIINCKGLRKMVGVSSKDQDRVLNGIAYKRETDQLYVTGKYWNSLFEIKKIEMQ